LQFGSDWDNSGPAWSPDGAFLAYNRVEPLDGDPPGHFRVHVIRADGTGDVALPPPTDPGLQEAWPLWSPDGRSIVVARFVFAPDGQGRLAILPADGSAGARDLGPTTHDEDSSVVKTWAPDGTRVISYVRASGKTFLIDPVTGTYEQAPWTAASEPDYRRLAP
jgi:Tol biopolymer transport system component